MSPEDLRASYKQALSSKDGQTILKDMEARFHMFGSTYSPDPTETAYREGQRTVVLFLNSMLQEVKQREDMLET